MKLSKIFKKKKYSKEKIKLKNGESQEYYIDSKFKWVAEVRRDDKIYIGNGFRELKDIEKQAVITHERGHLKFVLFKTILKLNGFAQTFSLLSIFLGLFFIALNFIVPINLFNISNWLWISIIILGLFIFIQFTLINWLSEIIADSNSVKLYGKRAVINTIGKFYQNKKLKIFKDWILHPPWKLRKKIMEELD